MRAPTQRNHFDYTGHAQHCADVQVPNSAGPWKGGLHWLSKKIAVASSLDYVLKGRDPGSQ